MTDIASQFPLTGYVVLRNGGSYRGVDRDPFEPQVIENEMASVPGTSGAFYTLYPSGWRRDAYHLFEDGRVPGTPPDVYLIERFVTAANICRLISQHIGSHEVLHCRISPINQSGSAQQVDNEPLLGVDVAYLGGDHYSAILNGLIINPHPLLLQKFGKILNPAGLFSHAKEIPTYMRDFRRLVPSEAASTFLHELSEANDRLSN